MADTLTEALDLDAIENNAVSMKQAGYPHIKVSADVLLELVSRARGNDA